MNVGPVLIVTYLSLSGLEMGLYCALITTAIYNLATIKQGGYLTLGINNGFTLKITSERTGGIQILVFHVPTRTKIFV